MLIRGLFSPSLSSITFPITHLQLNANQVSPSTHVPAIAATPLSLKVSTLLRKLVTMATAYHLEALRKQRVLDRAYEASQKLVGILYFRQKTIHNATTSTAAKL